MLRDSQSLPASLKINFDPVYNKRFWRDQNQLMLQFQFFITRVSWISYPEQGWKNLMSSHVCFDHFSGFERISGTKMKTCNAKCDLNDLRIKADDLWVKADDPRQSGRSSLSDSL